MNSTAVEGIVDRLVRDGAVPDNPEARSIAESTVKEVTRQRIVRLVQQIMESWLKEDDSKIR